MKKSLVITLALVFVLGIVSTAFAAANPFVDVPAKHWAYESVSKLAKAGIVDGYGDGTFRGDKNMTRYEMAQIVAKAMANSDKADAALKAEIAKLQVEFATELNNLGVRVAKLEKNASTVKMTGETRLRYRWNDNSHADIAGTKAFDWRQRLSLSATVSPNIDFNARLYAGNTLGETNRSVTSAPLGTIGTDNSFDADRFYFTLKGMMGIDTIQVGKFGLTTGKGLVLDNSSDNDGITVAQKFGKANVFAFHTEQAASTALSGISVLYTPTKDFDMSVAYYDNEKTEVSKAFEYGASYNFGNGFSGVAAFVDTDNTKEVDGQAWVAQLTWNANNMYNKQIYGTNYVANKAIAHDYGFAVSYRDIDKFGLPAKGAFNTYNTSAKSNVGENNDVQAWMFIYQNVVQKNIVMTVDAQQLETKSTGLKDKVARVFFELYF